MKELFFISLGMVVATAMVILLENAYAAPNSLPERDSLNLTRAPGFRSAGVTAITVDNVTASSTALTAGSCYAVQCQDDTYMAWFATSSGAVTSTTGFVLADTALFRFTALKEAPYLSLLNVNEDSTCYYSECF